MSVFFTFRNCQQFPTAILLKPFLPLIHVIHSARLLLFAYLPTLLISLLLSTVFLPLSVHFLSFSFWIQLVRQQWSFLALTTHGLASFHIPRFWRRCAWRRTSCNQRVRSWASLPILGCIWFCLHMLLLRPVLLASRCKSCGHFPRQKRVESFLLGSLFARDDGFSWPNSRQCHFIRRDMRSGAQYRQTYLDVRSWYACHLPRC